MMIEEAAVTEQTTDAAITEQSLDEAARVRYLHPEDYELLRSPAGTLRLTLRDERSVLRVKARRCFPFSFSSKYISLRDGGDEEIGIIKDLGDLSKEHRRWIEDDLEMRYFAPRVKSIESIKQRFGGTEWHLQTDRGPKRIITRGIHDTLSEVAPGRYMITDVDGNRYEFQTGNLDEASRSRLERLI